MGEGAHLYCSDIQIPLSGTKLNDRSPSFRSDPPAARMREIAQGSARLPRRGDRRRHLRSAPAQPRGHRRAGIFPKGRRARLARHDLAEEIWRPRAHLPRALCGDRGNARRQRADAALLRRRPPERPGAAEIRARKHQDGHPAADLPRRGLFCHRHERAEFGLRPVRREDKSDQNRRRLSDQRHQDLDLVGAYRRLHDRDLSNFAADQERTAATA